MNSTLTAAARITRAALRHLGATLPERTTTLPRRVVAHSRNWTAMDPLKTDRLLLAALILAGPVDPATAAAITLLKAGDSGRAQADR